MGALASYIGGMPALPNTLRWASTYMTGEDPFSLQEAEKVPLRLAQGLALGARSGLAIRRSQRREAYREHASM